jgi:hypothetical protein
MHTTDEGFARGRTGTTGVGYIIEYIGRTGCIRAA